MSKYADRYGKIDPATIDRSILQELAPGEKAAGKLSDDQWRMWGLGKEICGEIDVLVLRADQAWKEHKAAGKMDCPNDPLCKALKVANEAYEAALVEAEEVLTEFADSVNQQYSIEDGAGFAVRRDGSVVLLPKRRTIIVRVIGVESIDGLVSFVEAATGRPYRGDPTLN